MYVAALTRMCSPSCMPWIVIPVFGPNSFAIWLKKTQSVQHGQRHLQKRETSCAAWLSMSRLVTPPVT
jgi:hypothetical protein